MANKNKKLRDALKGAQEAVLKANDSLESVIKELDDDEVDSVAGGMYNPFASHPRTPYDGYDNDRKNY